MSRKPVPDSQKKTFIQVGLPKELHDVVVAMAAEDDRSISNIGLMLIREAVDARNAEAPVIRFEEVAPRDNHNYSKVAYSTSPPIHHNEYQSEKPSKPKVPTASTPPLDTVKLSSKQISNIKKYGEDNE